MITPSAKGRENDAPGSSEDLFHAAQERRKGGLLMVGSESQLGEQGPDVFLRVQGNFAGGEKERGWTINQRTNPIRPYKKSNALKPRDLWGRRDSDVRAVFGGKGGGKGTLSNGQPWYRSPREKRRWRRSLERGSSSWEKIKKELVLLRAPREEERRKARHDPIISVLKAWILPRRRADSECRSRKPKACARGSWRPNSNRNLVR